MLQQRGFVVRVWVLDWPAWSPVLSTTENMRCKKYDRDPRLLAPEGVYQARMGDKLLYKLQKLVTSVPKQLLSIVKRKSDATQW